MKSGKEMSVVQRIVHLASLMRKSFAVLKQNDPLRMGGATAFFATFALPPILIIFTQFFRVFVDPEELSAELIERLAGILGDKSAEQVKRTFEAVTGLGQEWYITVFGFLFLLFVATTLFEVIKNSVAQIWDIRLRPHPGFLFRMKYRMRSLVIIFLAGLLFLAGIFLEGLQALLGEYIDEIWNGWGLIFNKLINEILFGAVVSIWFTCLFRFLTAGRPKWKTAFSGGVFTAILFTSGKWVLTFMLSKSNISSIYGASGSTILIMLFVFYSSMIFYYGACFVKILSEVYDKPIRPVKQAFVSEVSEREFPA